MYKTHHIEALWTKTEWFVTVMVINIIEIGPWISGILPDWYQCACLEPLGLPAANQMAQVLKFIRTCILHSPVISSLFFSSDTADSDSSASSCSRIDASASDHTSTWTFASACRTSSCFTSGCVARENFSASSYTLLLLLNPGMKAEISISASTTNLSIVQSTQYNRTD